jgi:hypothetical protein
MAMKNVNGSQKATDMKVGDTFSGYLTEIKEAPSQNGDGLMYTLVFTNNGNVQSFFPAGNIKYMIEENRLKAGLYTEITRIADKQVGKLKKKMSSQFRVEQDDENVIQTA